MVEVSVVIPIYNTEKSLKKCLDSLRMQKFKNVEFILVDDGSNDSSLKICNEYSSIDDRFIVLHKNNGGSVSARNAGINIANGEFIVFIDSDDYVDDTYIYELYKLITTNKTDIVVKNFINEDGSTLKPYHLKFNTGKYDGEEKCKILDGILATNIQGDKTIYSALWGKMYAISLIKDNYLKINPAIREGEDLLLLALCCTSANSIYIDNSNSSKYHYVQNSGQVTKNYDSNYESRVRILFDNLIALNKEVYFMNFEKQFEKLVVFYTCKGFENIFFRKSNLKFSEKIKRVRILCLMANGYTEVKYDSHERFLFRVKRIIIKNKMVYTIYILYSIYSFFRNKP